MSGVLALRGIVLEALRGDAALLAFVNAVADGSAAKVSAPALTLGACTATEWGAKGLKGLSVRVPLTLIDRADEPVRLNDAAVRIDAVMDVLPDMAAGWRIGAVLPATIRTVRTADGQWTMLLDYVVRLSRAQ